MREPRHPAGVLKPRGPYSPAVIAGGRLLFTASQGPLDPATGKEPPGGIEVEARQALSNIRAIVEGCGGSLRNRGLPGRRSNPTSPIRSPSTSSSRWTTRAPP